MEFLGELLNESIEFIFLVCIAGAGIAAGIALRKNKDKKTAAESDEEKQ